jgi:hypothetical protein
MNTPSTVKSKTRPDFLKNSEALSTLAAGRAIRDGIEE